MKNRYKTLKEAKQEWPLYEGRNILGQLQPGDKINKLTILYKSKRGKEIYNVCQCDCGTFLAAKQNHIKSNHIKSCGCLIAEEPQTQAKDLIGQTFGRLTVLERAGTNEHRQALWLCQCSCYNKNGEHPKKIIVGQSLIQGTTKSCGCINKEKMQERGKNSLNDLTGQIFGHWMVIKRAPNQISDNGSNSTMWLCQCDCKNKTIKAVNAYSLTHNKSTNCGCQFSKSIGEDKIVNIFTKAKINFEREKIFKTCKQTNSPYRFDFYIPEKNYLIEYDGIQHSEITGGKYSNEQKVKETQKHDKFKNQWCKENDIPLIRIPYTHYEDLCLEDLLLETTTFLVE